MSVATFTFVVDNVCNVKRDKRLIICIGLVAQTAKGTDLYQVIPTKIRNYSTSTV